MIKVTSYHIQTCMGKLTPFGDKLPFLKESELEEFNLIGSSGKSSSGEKTNWMEYLSSIRPKDGFSIVQTKFDNGDFTEKYIITKASTE